MTTLMATADEEVLARKVDEFVNTGRFAPARALLQALRRKQATPVRVGALAARLAAREGRWQDAASELDSVLALAPGANAARKLRADVRLHLNDRQGAVADAADAVIEDPADAEAKALLGAILVECGQPQDAAICLREALSVLHANPLVWLALARAADASGNPEDGLAVLRAALANLPGRAELHNALLLALIRHRRFPEAVASGRATGAAGLLDATGFGLLGHALSSAGRHNEAADAYREAFKLAPEDPYVAHLVAASGAVAGQDRAPVEYVRTVFDGYAERFESHLISLGYRVPGLIRQVVQNLLAQRLLAPGADVLDLGCGTGMAALAVADLGLGAMTGVDLSPRMLALAAEKHLYAQLEEADAEAFLARAASPWGLVLAADMLCYLGALDTVLPAISGALAPGGIAVFTLEAQAPAAAPGWSLGRHARFAHGEAYLRTSIAAAGLHLLDLRREALRLEALDPVEGFLVVAQRPGGEA